MKSSRVALLLAILAAVILFASGIGVRLGLWPFPTGLRLLGWAAYVGLAAAALALILLIVPKTRARQVGWLLPALLLGVAVAWLPWHNLQQARRVPPIHDISTDTANPPAFVAILPLRANASNPATYGGADVAAAQHQAYADIRPHQVDAAKDVAFQRALAAAKGMGWDLVAADPASGRIEATATTFWFGFKDDIVIRVAGSGSGSVVDVRSVSRVGKSDVGTNAKRIRAYLKAFDAITA